MGLVSFDSRGIAPFRPNTSVSAVTASHPFEGGNAGVFDKAAAGFDLQNDERTNLQIMQDISARLKAQNASKGRMNTTGLSMALLNMQMALPGGDGSFRVSRNRRREIMLTMGKALMQLWTDLEEEERAGVGQKALA